MGVIPIQKESPQIKMCGSYAQILKRLLPLLLLTLRTIERRRPTENDWTGTSKRSQTAQTKTQKQTTKKL